MTNKTNIILSFIGVCAFYSSVLKAQLVNDGFEATANDWVRVYHQQLDGKILVGGRFTTITHGTPRNHIARLHANGSIDLDFDANANGEVVAIVQQPNGSLLVAGGFTEIGGQTRNSIARLNLDGSVASGFIVDANDGIWAVAYVENGIEDDKILIGGSFTQINGVTQNRIARLNLDGSLDMTFNPGQGADNAAIYSLLVQNDNKIVLGGSFSTFDGQPLANAVRLHPDGPLDTDFQPNPNGAVLALSQQPDHKLLMGGAFTITSAMPQKYLARYHPNGLLDGNFMPDINDQVSTIHMAAYGWIYIGGKFTAVNGMAFDHLARIQDNGLTAQFSSGNFEFANDQIDALLIQSDGKILIGGEFTASLGEQRIRMARLYPGGELDRRFNTLVTGVNSTINSTIQYLGLFVAGSFSGMNVEAHNNIAKLNIDGINDDVFDAQTNGEVLAMMALPNQYQNDTGSLLIGGKFTQINGLSANHIAKIRAFDGSLDTGFNAFTNGDVHALLHIETEDKYLIAGQFTQVNGSTRNNIAMLNSDGSLDMSFNVTANNRVNALVMQPDGKVLMGGVFTEVNGIVRQKLARFTFVGNNGFVDGFNPTPDGNVASLLVQSNGFIWVGGFFDNIGGESRRGLAIITENGDVRANMDLPLNVTGFVKSMALQADNAVIIGGQISSVDGLTRDGLAKIEWSSVSQQYEVADWIANSNGTVNSVMLQTDGKVIVGGAFNSINGITRINLARLSQKTAAQNNLSITEQDVTIYQLGSAPTFTKPPTVSAFGSVQLFTEPMMGSGAWTYQHDLEQNRFFTPTRNYDFTVRAQVSSGGGNGSSGEVYFSKRAFFNDLIFKNGF